MNTVRRLLYRDIAGSVLFVALAFLSLFYFIDFVEEIDRMNRAGAGALKAAALALMAVPGHFYELFPIAVLIGSIFSLARMAQSSEFTILRTGGLGPRRALGLLASMALVFAVLTFAIGDFAGPWFERQGDAMRARFVGDQSAGRKGAWLKDHQLVDGQERSFSVNVGQASSSGRLQDVRIFEFDLHGALISRIEAKQAVVDARGTWKLEEVLRTDWLPLPPESGPNTPIVREVKLPQLDWQSSLNAGVIAAAVLPAKSMSTLELYRYTEHLSAQEQSAQAHNIQFWRKAFYPFACFVMVALALPFAYLHGRAGGISLKVFGGIMLGISFVLLNNVAGHLGMLRGWTPWLTAAVPSLAYLGLSMAAFTWLVRYR
ncbi:LPS export ABC transporter permease LptG [Roseateles violae]|uniref:LPS export ABC transporter permease LptG n=1 Tax=Roseateles violae TaxID=3058042 RepID=A0ABT8DPZ7_9BURK|nr:LPS export ABC transporter permease LptG [Pelomonas sp. PFR6]MDN3920426.1 LPS export ABC transporter permease LptG [Pelomonas sp. PFR6]